VDRCIRHHRDTASGRAKLEAAIRRALADPAVRDKLKAVAYAPDGRGGEEFRQLIDADIKAYADVVRTANLKFD
jgi:tripartite-type tricarboxylate transporter receptor subunit TctC